jgi:hypothetical protein
MSKVLYVGNYYDANSGWSSACRANILALDTVGIDVVARAIYLSPNRVELSDRLKEIESRDSSGADIVIQQVLPPHFEFDGRYAKNLIALFVESDRVPREWAEKINLSDGAIVFSETAKTALFNSGVKVKVYVARLPLNLDKFSRSYKPHPLFEQFPDQFFFYSLGDFTNRKNYHASLRAFHSEFAPWEPVQYIFKLNSQYLSPQQIQEEFSNLSREIKKRLRLYPEAAYKPEIIVSGYTDEEELLSLMAGTHCYVSSSASEGFNLPCAESMAMGKLVIAPRNSSHLDYLHDDNSFLVDCKDSPCFDAQTIPNLQTSEENWRVPDINHLRRVMRAAYKDYNSNNCATMRKNAQTDAFNLFNYEDCGNRLKGFIERA